MVVFTVVVSMVVVINLVVFKVDVFRDVDDLIFLALLADEVDFATSVATYRK